MSSIDPWYGITDEEMEYLLEIGAQWGVVGERSTTEIYNTNECSHCHTHGGESKFHPGTCANCGAPL